THLHVGADAADSYRLALELFATAEQLGYDSGWVAQHHFLNGSGRLPSTLTFLAAAAERTRRIRLGTAIVILPLEDPIRVAEDAAVVDAISGGRLELGLGTGGDPLTFAAFGRDVAARRERFAEAFDVLVDALPGRPGPGSRVPAHARPLRPPRGGGGQPARRSRAGAEHRADLPVPPRPPDARPGAALAGADRPRGGARAGLDALGARLRLGFLT